MLVPVLILSIFALFFLLLITELVMSIADPFWYYFIGFSPYKETRLYDRDVLNISEIMSRDFGGTEKYVIRKRPDNNALTIRMKFGASVIHAYEAGNRAVVLFNEESKGIGVTFIYRVHNLFLFSLIPIIFFPFLSFYMIYHGNYEGVMIWFVLVPSSIFLYYILIVGPKKKACELFNLLMVYLGVEEKLDIKSLM